MEAPCFSRGELDFSPAESGLILRWALALDLAMPARYRFHCKGRPGRSCRRSFSLRKAARRPSQREGGNSENGIKCIMFRLELPRSAEALLPSHKCGGFHQKAPLPSFPAAC